MGLLSSHQDTMKLFICLALCAFAAALPSAEVDPAAVVPESAPESPDMTLMEASYNDAKHTITALLQEGKDDSACRDMAKTTADEVTAAVDAQQKQLASMANGDSCNDEGQSLIDTANKNQEDADKAKNDAQKALTDAKSEKFNFGDFAYNDLQEGQCGTFFNSQTWKNAYHMQCVLDGKTTNNCDVPALPTVQPVPYGEGTEHACGCTYPPFSGKTCKAPRHGGQGESNDLFMPNALWSAKNTADRAVWECGDGMVNGKKQQFMLSRIYIGYRYSTVDDWKKCITKDGWRPLCDYKGACTYGPAGELGALWPSKCPIHWHNAQMPNSIHHPGYSTTSSWRSYSFNSWQHSLRYTSGMRSDGSGTGYAAATYPTSSWQNSGAPNSIMCILPLNNCEKGECGFSG